MRLWRILGAFLFLLVALPPVRAAESIVIANANFTEWKDGAPQGWTVAIGATSGSDVPSRLKALEGGGIEFGGEAATGQWRAVSQKVAVTGGSTLRLRLDARTAGLKREGNQFDNCFVGLNVLDAAGKRLSMPFRNLFETQWAPGQLVVKLPDSAAAAEVLVFLSKSGTLQVRNLRLEQLSAGDSFDVLVDELDRYYSFFALKKFDWKARSATYAAAARAVKTPDEFAKAVQPLLAELKDLHVVIRLPDGKELATHSSNAKWNFEARTIAGKLKDVKQIGRMGFTARTPEGFGYIALGSLAADDKTTADMLAAYDGLLDAKGLIIDIRASGGGREPVAQQFVARLIDKPLTYAKNQFRNGPAYTDLVTLGTRAIAPHSDKPFRGPVVGLIGPGCVSSGEGMALMLKALPGAALIGQPTRGASANPQPVTLPNGVTVRYSTWLALGLDGQPLEGVGVAPATRIEDDATGVKGLQAAIESLQARP